MVHCRLAARRARSPAPRPRAMVLEEWSHQPTSRMTSFTARWCVETRVLINRSCGSASVASSDDMPTARRSFRRKIAGRRLYGGGKWSLPVSVFGSVPAFAGQLEPALWWGWQLMKVSKRRNDRHGVGDRIAGVIAKIGKRRVPFAEAEPTEIGVPKRRRRSADKRSSGKTTAEGRRARSLNWG